MGEDKTEFKIKDKRASQGNTEDTPTQTGDGFVMKEKKEETSSEPHQIDFSTLVFSFATSAMINMGVAPDPQTKKVQKNLEVAKQNIEILRVLKDKTKGNLTTEENELLENLIKEIQLLFVQSSR